MLCTSWSAGRDPTQTIFTWRPSSRIRSSTPGRSPTRGPGSRANPTKKFTSTRAAKTTSTGITLVSVPALSGLTEHAATSIRLRFRRQFPRAPPRSNRRSERRLNERSSSPDVYFVVGPHLCPRGLRRSALFAATICPVNYECPGYRGRVVSAGVGRGAGAGGKRAGEENRRDDNLASAPHAVRPAGSAGGVGEQQLDPR